MKKKLYHVIFILSLFITMYFSFPFTIYADDNASALTCSSELELEKEFASKYESENIASFSLTTPSCLTESQLERGLQGELAEYSNLFIEAEKEYGVNAIFLSALAALESGWGQYPNSDNSYFGWTNGDYYNNPEDSILPTAKKISEYYLSEDGIYHEGYTISDVNIHYNGREEWEERVSNLMTQIAGEIY